MLTPLKNPYLTQFSTTVKFTNSCNHVNIHENNKRFQYIPFHGRALYCAIDKKVSWWYKCITITFRNTVSHLLPQSSLLTNVMQDLSVCFLVLLFWCQN